MPMAWAVALVRVRVLVAAAAVAVVAVAAAAVVVAVLCRHSASRFSASRQAPRACAHCGGGAAERRPITPASFDAHSGRVADALRAFSYYLHPAVSAEILLRTRPSRQDMPTC